MSKIPQNIRSRNQAPPKTSKGPNTACVAGARASAILDAAYVGERMGGSADTGRQGPVSLQTLRTGNELSAKP